jgi:putative transposase
MTLAEFEKWFCIEVIKYHATPHRTLGMTPLAAWQEKVDDSFAPRFADDPEALMLSFLPAITRTVTREGITRECIHYQHPVLGLWLGARVLVRYNPHDLSKIFVKGPSGPYVQVPYRNVSRPPVSDWERTLAKKSLAIRGLNARDEGLIFDAIEAQRQIVDEATQQTRSKKARVS